MKIAINMAAGGIAGALALASTSLLYAQTTTNAYSGTGMTVTGPASEKPDHQLSASGKASRNTTVGVKQSAPPPSDSNASPGAGNTSPDDTNGVNSAIRSH
jgi:hypothetical protein